MDFLQVQDSRNEIILDTPNRDEILKAGPPENSKYNILGRGSYGAVFKAVYAGKQVAVKIIKNGTHGKSDAICNEANILGWRHRNIVQLFKIESTINYGIVIMERFPGQCLQVILNSIDLPLEHRIYVVSDMANALIYCHKRRILHLDVKPQNVLVALISPSISSKRRNLQAHERGYICKICDFGSSVALRANEQENTRKRIQGTVRYMSPEVLREDILSPAADVFSLGVTMWQLKSSQLPYSWIECNETVAYQVVKNHLRPNHHNSQSNAVTLRVDPSFPHKNCLCEHYSTEISHRTLDHIRSALHKTKTLSPFASKNFNSPNRKSPAKLKNQISRNLIGKFQSTFAGLKENLLVDKISCNTLEEEFKSDFPLHALFSTKQDLVLPEAENEYQELFKLCWSNEAVERPSTMDLRRKLESLLMQTY